MLLAALLRAWHAWCNERELLLDLEGHGRAPLFDDVDLSRTVGWFTSICPLRLRLEEGADAVATLQTVASTVASMPDRGFGFGLLRYLNPHTAAALRALPAPEIAFNYLGQFDAVDSQQAMVRTAPESAGEGRDQRFPRRHLLEINGSLTEGSLSVDILYSTRCHDAAAIGELATHLRQTLLELVQAACGLRRDSGFPQAGLSGEDMTTVLADLGLTPGDRCDGA